jgi:hypothetical protein
VALLAAFALWGLGVFAARILSVVVGAAYALLTALSFTAFFGFMSTVQHRLEQDTLVSSSRYEQAQASVDSASARVEALSRHADPLAVARAEEELGRLRAEQAAILSRASAYTSDCLNAKTDKKGAPFTSRMNEACAGFSQLGEQIRQQQALVSGHAEYQSALAHRAQALSSLAQLDSGEVSTGSHLHPMFVDLARLFSAAPEDAKVVFMFVSSAAAEILGTLSIVVASLLGRRRSFTLDEIEAMSGQLREQHARLQHALGLAQPVVSLGPPLEEPAKKSPRPPAATGRVTHEAAAFFAPPAPCPAEERPAPRAVADKNSEIRIPDPEVLYRDLSEAILRGECPPEEAALVERFRLTWPAARRYLKNLARQGYLDWDGFSDSYRLALGKTPKERLGEGVAYQKKRILFPQPQAQLPARRKDGSAIWLPWGRRKQENGALPPGGLVPLAEIRAGEWDAYHARPVIIPANGYLLRQPDGRTRWQPLDAAHALQGMVAEGEGEQRIYLVTLESENTEVLPRVVSLAG